MPRSRSTRDVRRVTDYSLMEAEVEPAKDDDEVDGALWEGIIGVENQLTGDGRLIELNALRWDTLPLPFRHVAADSGAHAGAVVVGRITHIERQENGDIFARGDFDMDSEQGREAARQVEAGLTTGVSMDLDDVSYELRLKGEVYDEEMLRIEEGAKADIEREKDAEGRVILQKGASDDEVQVTTDGRIRAATLLSIPAFEPARIALAADDLDEEFITLLADEGIDCEDGGCEDEAEFNWVDDVGGLPQYIKRIAKHLKKKGMTESHAIATAVNAVKKMCATGDINFPGKQDVNVGSRAEACAAVADWERKKAQAKASSAETITAGGYPIAPPKVWFLNPDLTEPTHIRISPEGRVYGHLAIWGTCHTAYPGQCVTPPENESGYAYFRTGTVLTKEGDEIPIGRITMDTLHAGRTLSAAQTMAHYEHTGRAAADVNVGEDAHGIWVAGALRPGVTDEQVRALRASPLSGDWRDVAGGLELIGALAVNVPGFPIPRTQGLVAGGKTLSLVASGMVAPEVVKAPGTPGAFSEEDLRYLKRIAHRERTAQESLDTEAAALARRVEALALARKVRGRRPFEFAGWEKQRRIPAGNGRLSGRWADMFNMPLSDATLADLKGGSAEAHLMNHPSVSGQTIFRPERQKFHKEFIKASVKGAKPAKGRQPRYTMMGGGPASGKSNLINARKGTDRDLEAGRVIVNPDIAKTGGGPEGRPDIPGIPEYAELTEKGDATAAGYAHEESSYMAKQLMQAVIDDGLDVTNDGTGNSSYGKLAAKVAQAQAEGYEVEGQYVTVPTEVALVRAKLRGYKSGRQVSSTMLIDTHASVSQVVPQALENRLFDGGFDLWDNSGPSGSDPIHVATFKPGADAPEILDQEAYDKFVAKADAPRIDVLRGALEYARKLDKEKKGDRLIQRAIGELKREVEAIEPFSASDPDRPKVKPNEGAAIGAGIPDWGDEGASIGTGVAGWTD